MTVFLAWNTKGVIRQNVQDALFLMIKVGGDQARDSFHWSFFDILDIFMENFCVPWK